MKRFYQTEWQNIPFNSFANCSSKQFPDALFYNSFYHALFEKYASYAELDTEWRLTKEEIAEWLVTRLAEGGRVLSVGCGLGYIEQYLWRKHSNLIDLHVQDYASDALRWLRQVLPPDRIHHGESCQSHPQFHMIYLSAVDYALSDVALVKLLSELRHALMENCKVIMISASFLDESPTRRIIQTATDTAKWLLERLTLYNRGQLWGWQRSKQEYKALMIEAGYSNIEDGFIDTANQHSYWIEGRTP